MRFVLEGVAVDIEHLTEKRYQGIREFLQRELKTGQKAREAIARTFLFAVRQNPKANPSDIWHHVIYRRFLEVQAALRPTVNAGQAWVRTGGEALEIFFGEYYAPLLSPHGVRLRPLISRDEKRLALEGMGFGETIGDAKLDTVLEANKDGQWVVFGGAHVKASLAERVSDDVPASERMIEQGYFSPLLTLDAKSFPPPRGDLVNKGELGSAERPSEKRKYIEQHGSFDNCYSYNLRTIPSPGPTSSGKKVYTLHLDSKPDQFATDVVAAHRSGHAR